MQNTTISHIEQGKWVCDVHDYDSETTRLKSPLLYSGRAVIDAGFSLEGCSECSCCGWMV